MRGAKAGLARLMGLIACLVPSALLCWALTATILGVWQVTPAFYELLAPVCLWVALFALGFTNGRTALVTLALAVVAALAALLTGGIAWLTAAFGRPDASLAWVIACPLAALVVGLSRRRVMLPPLVIVTGGAFALLSVIGHPPTLMQAALACVALVAYTARSALHRWSGVSTASSEGHLALWVLPVAALLAVGCWASVRSAPQLPKLAYLADKLDFINAYLMDMAGYTTPRTGFSLVPTGMQPDPVQLGGPVEENDDEVLSVTASDPHVLLRGAVYADYDGHAWSNHQAVSRYKLADSSRRSAIFNQNLPESGDLPTREVTVKVTHLSDGPSSLFVPFRVDNLTTAEAMTLILYCNDRGEVFATQDLVAGRGYTVTATLPTQDLSTLAQWMRAHPDPEDDGYARAASDYLALPVELPASVREMAQTIAGSADNDAQRVELLGQYLAQNTTYSLEPVVPPPDEDFVAYFLETRTGYCTYYATAMTVLARSLGIPARYVEGYHLPEGARSQQAVTVTQREAHAWCEVYLRGIGWIPVDVSAADEDAPQQTPPTQEPEPTPTPTPPPQEPPEPTPPPQEPPQTRPFPWTALWIALAVLALAFMVIFVPILARGAKERRACRTPEGALVCHYHAILRLLGYVGLAPQQGETLARFAARVDKDMAPRRVSAADVAAVMMARSYGPPAKPSDHDVQTLALYRERLARTIRTERGWWFYTLRERLRWKS